MLVASNVDHLSLRRKNLKIFDFSFCQSLRQFFSKLSSRTTDVTIFVLDSFLVSVSSLSNNIGSTLAGLPAQSIVPQFHAVLFIVSWKK